MNIQNYQLTPYKFPSELESLYKWLFLSNDISLKRLAINKIRYYLTKSSLPHSLEISALLIESKLNDNNSSSSDLSTRLQYSMCIIKFVNGLLDPYQQSMFNISLHKLAIELNLPDYFVESRHISTHEKLPSLEMLRIIIDKALNWLKVNYWEIALNEYKSLNLLNINTNDWINAIEKSNNYYQQKQQKLYLSNNPHLLSDDDIKQLHETLKNIKKYRKLQINGTNNNTSQLSNQINTFKSIINKKSHDSIINILISNNYLILNGEKSYNLNIKQINGIRMIWSNLLEKLPLPFIEKLWIKLFKLSTIETNSSQLLQLNEWIVWILTNISFINHSNINQIIDLLLIKSQISVKCLPIIKEKYSTLLSTQLDKKLSNIQLMMDKFWVFEETINDKKHKIEGDLVEESMKKPNQLKPFLFTKAVDDKDWRPIPFGCPIPY
ncbi:rRNA-processing protein [Pichia kluyveri]|uniref:rRNA-processing protein n=1 Tax=Pichia kluyveri TaxID=36015 RepID=A0AAV5R6R7_PICKL|nr:rRNA-processing protein [Pichia kluyveri]